LYLNLNLNNTYLNISHTRSQDFLAGGASLGCTFLLPPKVDDLFSRRYV